MSDHSKWAKKKRERGHKTTALEMMPTMAKLGTTNRLMLLTIMLSSEGAALRGSSRMSVMIGGENEATVHGPEENAQ